VVRRIEKIETAIEPNFQNLFVAALTIPSKTDPFPEPRPADRPAGAAGDDHRGWATPQARRGRPGVVCGALRLD